MNEFQFLAGQTAFKAWSSFHRSFQTARTQNPYRKHFSSENIFFLCSEQKQNQKKKPSLTPAALCRTDDKLPPDSPTISGSFNDPFLLLGIQKSYLLWDMRRGGMGAE